MWVALAISSHMHATHEAYRDPYLDEKLCSYLNGNARQIKLKN